jgi:hypothetical protein
MARLGSRVGVRISPFSRSMALEQLLRGVALDGNLGRALAELREEMRRQLGRYEQLDLPEVADWVARGRLTLAAWSAIEEGFAGEPSEGPSP